MHVFDERGTSVRPSLRASSSATATAGPFGAKAFAERPQSGLAGHADPGGAPAGPQRSPRDEASSSTPAPTQSVVSSIGPGAGGRERRSGRLNMVIQAGFVALAVLAVLVLQWGFQ
jgi:hypothetical protein